ncbi:mite group 2 allergen-like Ixo r 2 [Ornithodoros turicata]|uniref:mite group 2 allergen-like Ixo r 2 n=1 Tax=Ornithodoros turicata TaxID=34597 RepID=UPI00313A104A
MFGLLLVPCLLAVATVAQQAIQFQHCGGGKILSAVVTPCNSDPCVVPVGTNLRIDFKVESNQNSSTVRFDPRVDVLGMQMPIPGINTDACSSGAVSCPVRAGEIIAGSIRAPVLSFLPSMTVTTTWKILGSEGLITCGSTKVTIIRN